MADKTEVEKLLDAEGKDPKDPALDPKKDQDPKDPKADLENEIAKKAEHLGNIKKAIDEGNEELRKLRAAKKDEKPSGEEEIPKINDDDPSAKAWNQRIKDTVAPALSELDKEREEVRSFAFQKFLEDKPALAKSPEKVKELLGYYEKIRTASERTQEGVLVDLGKAYAIVFHEEILDSARKGRAGQAAADSILADVATDRGATGYREKKDSKEITLTEEDRLQLLRWGIDPEEWKKEKAKYGNV